MRRAARTLAMVFGVIAGAASIEHGIFEVLRGNVRPEGLMIASMGPPCQPERVWNACEPALTILPNFLVTGILAILIGLLVLMWVGVFIQKRYAGIVLLGLSILMLLFGGGIFPPLFGIIGGVVGTRIHVPLRRRRTSAAGRFLAKLWPWPLVALAVWLLAQWIVGYALNEYVLRYAAALYVWFFLILGPLVLSIVAASAYDHQHEAESYHEDTVSRLPV